MVDGVFPTLVVAGLFLLVAAVIVGTVVMVRRGGARRQGGRSAASPAEDRPISTGPTASGAVGVTAAQDPAIGARPERETSELRRQADAVMAAAQSARAEAADEARQQRAELREQRTDLERREQRLSDREERLDAETRSLEDRSHQLDELKAQLKAQRRALAESEAEQQQVLERLAGLTAEQAKAELVAVVEHDAKRQAVLVARDIERQASREANARAQMIVVGAIQRVASEQTSESVVSAVHLPGDDMKGRIIGREGRNIRAFEQVTGVNVMIDDTPESVLLSCFDPVRRETARITLTELVKDGRNGRAGTGDVDRHRRAGGGGGDRVPRPEAGEQRRDDAAAEVAAGRPVGALGRPVPSSETWMRIKPPLRRCTRVSTRPVSRPANAWRKALVRISEIRRPTRPAVAASTITSSAITLTRMPWPPSRWPTAAAIRLT